MSDKESFDQPIKLSAEYFLLKIKADLERENIPIEKAGEIWNIGIQSYLKFQGTAKTMTNPRLFIQMYDGGNR